MPKQYVNMSKEEYAAFVRQEAQEALESWLQNWEIEGCPPFSNDEQIFTRDLPLREDPTLDGAPVVPCEPQGRGLSFYYPNPKPPLPNAVYWVSMEDAYPSNGGQLVLIYAKDEDAYFPEVKLAHVVATISGVKGFEVKDAEGNRTFYELYDVTHWAAVESPKS